MALAVRRLSGCAVMRQSWDSQATCGRDSMDDHRARFLNANSLVEPNARIT